MPHADGQAVLDALVSRTPIGLPVALVAAHPDDEAIGAGASLHLFRHLLLIHVTDGAPEDGRDARLHGFDSPAAYAAARRTELAACLAAGNAAPALAELGVADQQASLRLGPLTDALAALLHRHGTRCIITHPYEGGHPDHDAAAFIVRRAASRLPAPPAILEMTSYHAVSQVPGGGWATGRFLPGPPAVTVALTPAEQAVKRAMFAAHATQREVLSGFGTAAESFRPAPEYDFAVPPHDGALNYEGFGWGWTGARWRALAAAADAALDGAPCAG